MNGPGRSSSRRRRGALAAAAGMACALAAAAHAQLPGASLPDYRDTAKTPEERAADLVSHMSLEEKAAQLINDAPAIPRLGVREYNWWNEGLHGVAALGEATVFPQAIGLAATFDEDHMLNVATVIGGEFRAKHLAEQHRFGGSDWFGGLTVWSPNVNIFRDPRWGRGQETYGEDPFLTARMGVAFVKGLQGNDPSYFKTIATPKHYAVHSGPEPSRHRDDIHPSAKDLHETYLPAFRATIVEANARSVMCAYNAVNGAPACASEPLLKELLRETWGFDGYVVSDCGAVFDIYTKDHHGYAQTREEGVAVALKSGMDLICGDGDEAGNIISAVRTGVLDEETVDEALVRLFTARFKLGQFDDPSKVFPDIAASEYDTEDNRALALTTAEKALVLLKNEGGLLPLKEAPRTIAVIGPNANTEASLVGNYNGTPSHPVTVLEGIKRRFPSSDVLYAEGVGLIDPSLAPIPSQALCLDRRCKKNGLRAARFENRSLEGHPAEVIENPDGRYRWNGTRLSGAIRWTGFLKAPETGVYTLRYEANGGYRISIDGESVVDAWDVDWRPSIAAGKVELEAGKTYAIAVEAFQRQDSGDEGLLWALPSDQGAADAVAAAGKADIAIFVAGLTAEIEGEEMRVAVDGFDGGDRTKLGLPAPQQALLEKIVATGAPTILVLINGGPISVNWADENVPAIIEAWYPGGQGGDAVARAIAGDFSPAGRLPVTIHRSADDLPAFADYDMANRTYRYFEGEPLYPFGYGLSYAAFAYDKARLSRKIVKAGEAVTLAVDVTNTGSFASDEVVQLYISRPGVAGAPIRSLAAFDRINLAPGETKTVRFAIDPRAMSVVDEAGNRIVAEGPAELWVGGGQPGMRAGLARAAGQSLSFSIRGAKNLSP